MTAQLPHVARIYLTNRTLWLVAGAAALGIGPMLLAGLVMADSRRDSTPLALPAVGMGMAVLAWCSVLMAKWQFCNARARLTPGYARAHLAVLTTLIVVGVGAYPVLTARTYFWNPLGIAACAASLAASVAWAMHKPSAPAGALAMGQFLSFLFPTGLAFWVLPENASRYALPHAFFLIAGWVGLLAWLRRLPEIREEDDDYALPIQAQQGSATRIERTQTARALARQMNRGFVQSTVGDRWHDRLAGVRAATIGARQRLLRYGFAPTPIWLMALARAATLFVMFYVISQWSIAGHRGARSTAPAVSWLMMMILLPSLNVGSVLAMRRARLPQELCLPLTRRQFVDGLQMVVAGNALLMAIVTYIAVLGLIAVTNSERLSTAYVVGLLALAFSAQLYAFGVIVWAARLTSGGARYVGALVALIPAFTLLIVGIEALPQPAPAPDATVLLAQEQLNNADAIMSAETRKFLERRIASHERAVQSWLHSNNSARVATLSAALATLGAIILVDARRRWLRLELG